MDNLCKTLICIALSLHAASTFAQAPSPQGGPRQCVTRANLRAALEEIMPPHPTIKPPPNVVALPRPTDGDCVNITNVKDALAIAKRRHW